MIINQISVFLENKTGALLDIIEALSDVKINLQAMSVAETADYGLLRIIVDDSCKAMEMLKNQGWICSSTDVLAVNVPDEPGSLRKILRCLSDNAINVAYSYAYLSKIMGKASIVLRVDDNDTAQQILVEHKLIEE